MVITDEIIQVDRHSQPNTPPRRRFRGCSGSERRSSSSPSPFVAFVVARSGPTTARPDSTTGTAHPRRHRPRSRRTRCCSGRHARRRDADHRPSARTGATHPRRHRPRSRRPRGRSRRHARRRNADHQSEHSDRRHAPATTSSATSSPAASSPPRRSTTEPRSPVERSNRDPVVAVGLKSDLSCMVRDSGRPRDRTPGDGPPGGGRGGVPGTRQARGAARRPARRSRCVPAARAARPAADGTELGVLHRSDPRRAVGCRRWHRQAERVVGVRLGTAQGARAGSREAHGGLDPAHPCTRLPHPGGSRSRSTRSASSGWSPRVGRSPTSTRRPRRSCSVRRWRCGGAGPFEDFTYESFAADRDRPARGAAARGGRGCGSMPTSSGGCPGS